jgi:hypothetical protein
MGEHGVRIPTKAINDSELKPIDDSDAKPITIGAKRRWRADSGRSVRHPSIKIRRKEIVAAGAVGMWKSRQRFPRGWWEEGKACRWLSTLSTAPSFPRLAFLLAA